MSHYFHYNTFKSPYADLCFSTRKPWDERLGLVRQQHSQIISFKNDVVNHYNAEALKYYRAGGDLREWVTGTSGEGDAPPMREPHFLVVSGSN
jgi:hypothetical protein